MSEKLRPDIDEYFLKIAKVVGQRSTCLRHNIGAVLVRDRQIVSTGYNGAPSGLPDCLELGCLRDQQKIVSGTMTEICRAVHAEQNAIVQAAKHGIATHDTTLYITHSPCVLCAKLIINAGVKRVVCYQYYPDNSWEELFTAAGIKLDVLEEPELEIGDIGERVLVVDRKLFEELGDFEGIKTTGIKKFYDGLLSGVKYVSREKAEHDLSLKQIIPQFVVRHEDKYFISKRLDTSDEERLRDIEYIAFGGHINPIDSSEKIGDVIEKSAKRELKEELDCDVQSIKLLGFVNDEKMAVSRYHLGVIYLLEAKNKKCRTIESRQYDGFWVPRGEMKKYFANGDSWSRYIWKDLIEKGII